MTRPENGDRNKIDSKTSKLYYPYTIGTGSPISHLFESISGYVADSGFDVTILSAERAPIVDHSGVKEFYIPDSIPTVSQLQYLRSALARHDIIHTGGLIPRHHLISRISHLRNQNLSHLHSFRIDVMQTDIDSKQADLVSLADAFTAVSEHTAQTARQTFDIDPFVVYNGVDTTLFRPDYDQPDMLTRMGDKPVFLFVGSLIERKRPKDVAEVARQVPDAEFLMIGGGELFESLRAQAKHLENLRIFGRLDKLRLPAIYANSTGLLFPSIREGCPNVVLEAMAAGIPVIGYKATSMPELVTDGKTGFLTQPPNIDGLVESVRSVMHDDTNRLGQQAREYIKYNHTFEHISKEYISIYNNLQG